MSFVSAAKPGLSLTGRPPPASEVARRSMGWWLRTLGWMVLAALVAALVTGGTLITLHPWEALATLAALCFAGIGGLLALWVRTLRFPNPWVYAADWQQERFVPMLESLPAGPLRREVLSYATHRNITLRRVVVGEFWAALMLEQEADETRREWREEGTVPVTVRWYTP